MGRKFKRVIEKEAFDALPEHDKELYDDKDGKYHFNALALTENEKALGDARNDAAKYRTQNVALTAQLEAFKGLDAAQVAQDKLELEALKAEKAAGDKDSGKKFEDAVAARVKVEVAPLNAKITELSKSNETLTKENGDWKTGNEKRVKHDAMREACVALECNKDVYAGRYPAALKWAEENAVIGADGKVTDKESGLGLKDALKHYQEEGHFSSWWGTSSGGDARGSGNGGPGVKNPWSAEHWNATEQGKILHVDAKRGEALAKAANVAVDAPFHPKNGAPTYNPYSDV